MDISDINGSLFLITHILPNGKLFRKVYDKQYAEEYMDLCDEAGWILKEVVLATPH